MRRSILASENALTAWALVALALGAFLTAKGYAVLRRPGVTTISGDRYEQDSRQIGADDSERDDRPAAGLAQGLFGARRPPDLTVPLREIALSEKSGEPAVPRLRSSGPYTDADARSTWRAGLPRCARPG